MNNWTSTSQNISSP